MSLFYIHIFWIHVNCLWVVSFLPFLKEMTIICLVSNNEIKKLWKHEFFQRSCSKTITIKRKKRKKERSSWNVIPILHVATRIWQFDFNFPISRKHTNHKLSIKHDPSRSADSLAIPTKRLIWSNGRKRTLEPALSSCPITTPIYICIAAHRHCLNATNACAQLVTFQSYRL